jgi:hypothetical protein
MSFVPPPPPPPASAGSLRLEDPAHSDRSACAEPHISTRAVVRVFPGGLCEVSVLRRPVTTRPSRSGPGQPVVVRRERKEVPRDVLVAQLQESARRARSGLRRRIMAGGLDHLLTLTYRTNMCEAAQAARDLTRFLRICRAKFGEFPYVAVVERQQRGAYHWHVAVRGWQDVRVLRGAWRRVVGDGNIDVRAWVKRSDTSAAAEDAAGRLAGYLAKYVGKSLAEGLTGLHRYRCSHGLSVEETTLEYDDEEDLGVVATDAMRRVAGREPRMLYCFHVPGAADNYPGVWARSWGGTPGELTVAKATGDSVTYKVDTGEITGFTSVKTQSATAK